MILVNNAAPPNQGGSVNGFAQTLCSGMRAAAPTVYGSFLDLILFLFVERVEDCSCYYYLLLFKMLGLSRSLFIFSGGSLLAWSLQNGLGMPFNYYFSFFFISASFLLQFVLTLLLPSSINYRVGNPLGKTGNAKNKEEKDGILSVHLDQ
jgi:hypothetical protein